MSKRCIFLISARNNLLKDCLTFLDENYNKEHNYTTLIFYHGNRYDNQEYQDLIKSINPQTEYRFHSINLKIPNHLEEKDMFWNFPNSYARSFGRRRFGYLHAINFYCNFINYSEFDEFDGMMMIDDDAWFKEKLNFDFFDELDRGNGMFGTSFTWNHFHPNHLDTRHNLFNWIKYYVDKYNVDVKNEQLKESLNGDVDNELFHTLKWNSGNCNIFNRKMFNGKYWKQYSYELNKIAGTYRYRWGDCEVIGLYAYIHLDNPLIDFELRSKGLYEPQIPNTQMVFS